MVRNSARVRGRWLAPRAIAALLLFGGCAAAYGLEKPKPDDPPKPAEKDKDKGKGPEHNISLTEEPGANDLFNRAAKARARAEKEPEAWPDCVKAYADILKKYPNTVYLDKWEGADKKLTAYKNGLYKSTRERVAAEIASLPPAALAVYRVINDPPARALYLDGQEQFDHYKMEQLARDYFQTTWSNDALAWLGESAFERGAWRDAAQWLGKAAANPGKNATVMSLLARQVLAYARAGHKADAVRALEALAEALKDPAKGALRLGSDEGDAALAKLKARVEAVGAGEPAAELLESNQWTTYFGNASHSQPAQPRPGKGLRKWSMRIDDLLYGLNTVSQEADRNEDASDPSMNQQLTIRNGYFYINDGQVYSAYPVGNPTPGVLAAGGNAKYMLPAENVKNPPKRKAINRNSGDMQQQQPPAVVQHPYFATLAGERAYGVLGIEAHPQLTNPYNNRFNMIRMRGGGGEDGKPLGPSNHLVCFGRQDTARETGILWSLKPGDPAFTAQTKVDQEWLKGIYFCTAPTYESGVLYVSAVAIAQATSDAWAAAFDADNGRLLWRTQICTAKPLLYTGSVQPDRGIPVAVANRTVYVLTNLGAVAALDAGGGTVKWIRIYDRPESKADQNFGTGEEIVQMHQFWAPNPPIVYKNRLIVTPQDSVTMYAYDTETGARVWERPRVTAQDAGDSRNVGGNSQPPQSSYRHVLGLVNGALLLTGTDILFVNALNGKAMTEAISVESPIRGRGAFTPTMALISTEKELLRLDIQNIDVAGNSVKLGPPQAYKWADPKAEAGSVYSAGGILYTVSHTHVNAYILWEELEARLKAQLVEKPDDFEARIELSDVYKSIERFDQTLVELEKARQSAEKSKGVAKAQEALLGVRNRKFETLMALGEKMRVGAKIDEAAVFFIQAYDVALAPTANRVAEPTDVLPVLALKAKAELFANAGKRVDAAQAYQQIILKHGTAVLQDQAQSSKMARLFAQMRLSELKQKDPSSYAAIDAEAKAALAAAGNDAEKRQLLITQYPNSEHAGAVLLALAQQDLEKAPDRARLNATRYLSRTRGGPDTALALALQAAACERLGLMSAAHTALTRLAGSDELKDVRVAAQALDPKAAPGEISAREWAAKRLEEPNFKRAPSEAVFAIGQGKVKREPAWTRQNTENTIPLVPDGIPPVEMRKAVFYIENQTELAAIFGRDGTDLWKPRPTAPSNCRGRAFWWERLLLVCGESTITAYDSAENGKVAWSQNLKMESSTTGYWCQIAGDRLIVSHTGNILQAFDAASGIPLWRNTLPGITAVPPVCGDGFVLITPANSNRLTAYNLDTGAAIWNADVLELSNAGVVNNNAKVSPIVYGDRIYVAQRAMKLRVLDAKTGKRTLDKDIDIAGNITGLRIAGDAAIVSLDGTKISVYRTDGSNTPPWSPQFPTPVNITDVFVDGDDLLVLASSSLSGKSELSDFSIQSTGKLKWKQGVANDALVSMRGAAQQMRQMVNNNIIVRGGGRLIIQRGGQLVQIEDDGAQNFTYGPDGSGGWLRENAARDHLVLMQSNYELTGNQSKVAALIDRVTGRSVWDSSLRNDPSLDGTGQPVVARIQFFDGGLVLYEANKRRAFVSLNGGDDAELKEMTEKAAKNPADAEVRIKLAAALYESGEREKGLGELVAILSDAGTPEAGFALAYKQFALLRQDFALKQRTQLVFQRVDKAPDVAGGAAGWENVPEKVFGDWREIFLSSEDLITRTAPKKDAYRAGDDLKAAFKGAYDDKALYIQIAVKDEIHQNAQGEGGRIDFGDSLILSFDVGLAEGEGYRGEAFELALGLGKSGKASGWRRVEHGRYTRGAAPLEKDFSVTRKEADRTTLYQIALPLEYLTLKPEAGAKFGFSFAVQDQDAGPAIDKSVGPSPGLVGSRKPKYFSRGMLGETK